MNDQNITIAPEQVVAIKEETALFMRKVYGWMTAGLIITGIVAYVVASMPGVVTLLYGQVWIFYVLLIVELLAVAYLSVMVNKMSATAAGGVFLAYSFLNGITFSAIFLVYEISSIGSVFFITAAMFGALSLYGYFTKTDLTMWGQVAFMGLVGLIVASLVNMFILNDQVFLVLAYFGVVIFTILTAYDTQKIKNMNIIGNHGTDTDKKEAIMGALTLYLDFINLFLQLLRIFGKRRR